MESKIIIVWHDKKVFVQMFLKAFQFLIQILKQKIAIFFQKFGVPNFILPIELENS